MSNSDLSDVSGCSTQRWTCSAGGRLRSGLRGGRHSLWSQHDVFGATLPPCGGVQPQHLFRVQLWTHLFRPRGKKVLSSRLPSMHWFGSQKMSKHWKVNAHKLHYYLLGTPVQCDSLAITSIFTWLIIDFIETVQTQLYVYYWGHSLRWCCNDYIMGVYRRCF